MSPSPCLQVYVTVLQPLIPSDITPVTHPCHSALVDIDPRWFDVLLPVVTISEWGRSWCVAGQLQGCTGYEVCCVTVSNCAVMSGLSAILTAYVPFTLLLLVPHVNFDGLYD